MRDILVEALTERFGDHHAFLARTMLDRIDACTATETEDSYARRTTPGQTATHMPLSHSA